MPRDFYNSTGFSYYRNKQRYTALRKILEKLTREKDKSDYRDMSGHVTCKIIVDLCWNT